MINLFSFSHRILKLKCVGNKKIFFKQQTCNLPFLWKQQCNNQTNTTHISKGVVVYNNRINSF